MTAAPREPTREEVEGATEDEIISKAVFIRAVRPDGAQAQQPYNEYAAELLRRLKERDALLAQAPKVWTADTIKDAPEGPRFLYSLWDYSDETWCLPDSVPKILLLHKSEVVRKQWPRAYGPFVLPPPPEEKGG